MPLVPQSVFSRWYRTDSWIYRNFAFCYQNPLWNRPIPKGYILCGLFWQSIIIGLIFMRTFVYSIIALKALFNLLHIAPMFDKIDLLCMRLWGRTARRSDDVTGAYLFLTLFMVTIGSLILFVLIYGGYHLCAAYHEAGALAALFLPLGLIVLLVACGIYADANSYKTDRCKVEWYVRAGTLLALVAGAWLMPTELMTVLHDIGSALALALAGTGHFFVSLFWAIGAGLSWLYHWFVGAIISFGLYVLFSVVVLAAITLVGWLVNRFVPMDRTPAQAEPQKAPLTVDQLAKYLWSHDGISGTSEGVYRRLLRQNPQFINPLSQSDDTGRAAVCTSIYAMVRAQYAAERAAQIKRDAQCKKVTEALEHTFSFVTPIGTFVKSCARNIWTFGAYMVALIKARKAGACPYLMFEDVQKPDDKA